MSRRKKQQPQPDQLADAAARSYIQLKVSNYLRHVDDSMMMLHFVTEAKHSVVGVVEGREALVGAVEAARKMIGEKVEAVIFNADARASKVRSSLDNEDHIVDCLITIVVMQDHAPAYRCYAYYELDNGLQFEQSDVEFQTIQDVVLDLNRVW